VDRAGFYANASAVLGDSISSAKVGEQTKRSDVQR
jgi:hypothetical protein